LCAVYVHILQPAYILQPSSDRYVCIIHMHTYILQLECIYYSRDLCELCIYTIVSFPSLRQMHTVLRDCMHSQDSDISCLMPCSETQPEYDTTAPDPRRCVLAFSLARQPRRSARVCPEHIRWPSLTRLRPPSCPPHVRPEGACRRPPCPPLCVKAHIHAPSRRPQ
jgi:hypothetical protein